LAASVKSFKVLIVFWRLEAPAMMKELNALVRLEARKEKDLLALERVQARKSKRPPRPRASADEKE